MHPTSIEFIILLQKLTDISYHVETNMKFRDIQKEKRKIFRGAINSNLEQGV